MCNLLRRVLLAGVMALLPFAASLSVSAEDRLQSLEPAPAGLAGAAVAAMPPAEAVSLPDAAPLEEVPNAPGESQSGGAMPSKKGATRLPEESDFPGGGQGGVEDAAAPPPGVGTPGSPQIEPLPAINAALKSALEARFGRPDPLGLLGRREREAIAAFYGARGFAPLWWRGGSPGVEAASVIERLRRAGEDGLDLKGFAPE